MSKVYHLSASGSHKCLTNLEKGFFGKPYIDDEGITYHVGDFVRAINDEVGIIISIDANPPKAPLLVYFVGEDTKHWVPCKPFEKVYWS